MIMVPVIETGSVTRFIRLASAVIRNTERRYCVKQYSISVTCTSTSVLMFYHSRVRVYLG